MNVAGLLFRSEPQFGWKIAFAPWNILLKMGPIPKHASKFSSFIQCTLQASLKLLTKRRSTFDRLIGLVIWFESTIALFLSVRNRDRATNHQKRFSIAFHSSKLKAGDSQLFKRLSARVCRSPESLFQLQLAQLPPYHVLQRQWPLVSAVAQTADAESDEPAKKRSKKAQQQQQR